MNEYEEKLKRYIVECRVDAEHLRFEQSTRSVAEAAMAVGADPGDFVKSICLVTMGGDLVVAIVRGEHRVSTSRVGKALGVPRPRVASPDEILVLSGYPVGGTPAFGYGAVFLIDPMVMEMDRVYSGGGSETSLVFMSVLEIQRVNNGRVVRVRK